MTKQAGAVAKRHAREKCIADDVFGLLEARFPLLEKERSTAAQVRRRRDLLIIVAALENVERKLLPLLGREDDPLHDRELSQLAAEVVRQEVTRNEDQSRGQRRLSVDGVQAAFVELRVRGVPKTRCYALIADKLVAAGCQVSADAIKQTIDPRWAKLSDADFSREKPRWE